MHIRPSLDLPIFYTTTKIYTRIKRTCIIHVQFGLGLEAPGNIWAKLAASGRIENCIWKVLKLHLERLASQGRGIVFHSVGEVGARSEFCCR